MRLTSTLISAGLAAPLLFGCAMPKPKPPPTMTLSFDAREHEQYAAQGTAQVVGQGFLRQRGGGTVTCAGSNVILAPSTPYFRQFMNVAALGGTPPRPAGAESVIRLTQCDAQGNFAFFGLPAERWLVGTDVRWRLRTSQGGTLLREIQTRAGQMTTVILSDGDYFSR